MPFDVDFFLLEPYIRVAGLLLAASLLHLITKRVVLRLLRAFSRKAFPDITQQLGDEPFRRMGMIVPFLVIMLGSSFLGETVSAAAVSVIQRISAAITVLLVARVISSLLDGIQVIYQRRTNAYRRPIKGYLQVIAIVVYFFAIILIIATLLNKSPLLLISGLGAMTAIFMLVFRDTILSLVAGVQLTTNDLLRVGDWIEMPQFNADGDVMDISLNVVKVQNWDKTITVIPAHKFIENSFKNWRGMTEFGGRRIKRSLAIDMDSVRFLTEEEVERFSKFNLLTEYIAEKKKDLAEYNSRMPPDLIASSRKLTNIGTYRAYVMSYLKEHPFIHKDRTLLVRQLQSTAFGVPLEIYCFSADIRWLNYESIQSDIFDHLMAIMPEFDLRIYQRSSSAPATTTAPML